MIKPFRETAGHRAVKPGDHLSITHLVSKANELDKAALMASRSSPDDAKELKATAVEIDDLIAKIREAQKALAGSTRDSRPVSERQASLTDLVEKARQYARF